MLTCSRWLALVALNLTTLALWAGNEFLVNQLTVDDQKRPAMAQLANGTMVSAWQSAAKGAATVWFRRFDGSGAPLAGEQAVFQSPGLDQTMPAVAGLADGGFVIAWSWRNGDGDDYSVAFRRYAADGVPMTPAPEQANSFVAGPQFQPQIAPLPGGAFVLVWVAQNGGADQDVFYRRFGAGGALDKAEVAANRLGASAVGAGEQGHPRVAALADGGFVIVYEDRGSAQVYGVRFDSSGSAVDAPGSPPTTKQFLVSQTAGFEYSEPTVAALTNGGFVAAMTTATNTFAASRRVRARIFSPKGLGGAEFVIGSNVERWERPQAVGLPNGEFAMVWQATGEGEDTATDAWSVWAQRFTSDGVPRLAPFMVNQFNTSQQRGGALAAFAGSGYGVSWQSFTQDGDRYGVFARVFDPDSEIPGRLFISRVGAPTQRQLAINFIGMGGRTHLLQSSATLSNWVTVLATNPLTGTFTFQENGSNAVNKAFRVQTP